MANNETAQGHRYQQRVNKYKLAHIAAGGDGWAEKYREEGRIAKEAADLAAHQAHEASVAGAAPDEEPAVVVAPNPVGAAVAVPPADCPTSEGMSI